MTAALTAGCLAALGLAACSGRRPNQDVPIEPVADGPRDAREDTMTTTSRWTATDLPDLQLDADLLDGVPAQRTTADGLTTLTQQGSDVGLALARGPAATLDALIASLTPFGGTAGAIEPATLCDRAARRVEIVLRRPGGEGLRAGPDGAHLESVAPQTRLYVAAAAAVPDGFVRALWIVDAAARDRLRADEAHFFASVRCR